MQCREFREIADTYLHDELLVETNIQVHSHMEHCADCRKEFGRRRELLTAIRTMLHVAVDLNVCFHEQFVV